MQVASFQFLWYSRLFAVFLMNCMLKTLVALLSTVVSHLCICFSHLVQEKQHSYCYEPKTWSLYIQYIWIMFCVILVTWLYTLFEIVRSFGKCFWIFILKEVWVLFTFLMLRGRLHNLLRLVLKVSHPIVFQDWS